MSSGLSSTPCADTADDEDLCKHSDRETQPPDLMQMTETFVWDEIFKNPIIAKTARPSSNSAVDSYDILETLSDGENGPHVDTDIVDNQDILQEEDWHDCELPNPESNLDFTFKRFSPGALTFNPFPDVEIAAASSVLNLDDLDDKMSFSESQATSQDEHIELMFGNDFHTLAGQDVGEALTQDSDSEDEALGISLAQTSLAFSISKTHPICLAEYSQDSALETGYHGETEGYTCQLANCASLQEEDDDLDLGVTFEKPCNNSGLLIHLSFDDYEASESGGDSVDFAAMHVPLEGIFSHHVATLDITWPPQAQNEYHLSHPLSRFVDNDEEMWLVE
ncbi:hypothetical protein H0H93_004304 [Arthromyces matolae]|nr:hypothetical protein H0H93_004304 [Arthromyces matolae]